MEPAGHVGTGNQRKERLVGPHPERPEPLPEIAVEIDHRQCRTTPTITRIYAFDGPVAGRFGRFRRAEVDRRPPSGRRPIRPECERCRIGSLPLIGKPSGAVVLPSPGTVDLHPSAPEGPPAHPGSPGSPGARATRGENSALPGPTRSARAPKIAPKRKRRQPMRTRSGSAMHAARSMPRVSFLGCTACPAINGDCVNAGGRPWCASHDKLPGTARTRLPRQRPVTSFSTQDRSCRLFHESGPPCPGPNLPTTRLRISTSTTRSRPAHFTPESAGRRCTTSPWSNSRNA